MGLWGKLTGRLDRDEFVQEMLKRVRAVRGECTYDEEKFAIKAGERVHFLTNSWADYQRLGSRRERHQLLARFSAALVETGDEHHPKSFDEARPFLRPMVRERMFYAMLRLNRRAGVLGGDDDVMERSLGAHLTVTAALDTAHAIGELSQKALDGWKVTLDEALVEAKKNLGRISHAQWPEARPGVRMAPFGDYYDAGRAALPHVIRQLKVRGEPVALVLQRGLLAVTGSDDERGLVALAEIGDEAAELPRAMSAFLVRLDGNEWVPHALSPDHPARAHFDKLRVQWTLHNYEEQKSVLQKLLGDDQFVASYMAFRDERGMIQSVAALTLGIPSLLPECDSIAVGEGEQQVARVPWDAGARICALAVEPDLYPPRFRTDGNLSPVQLEALRAEAVS